MSQGKIIQIVGAVVDVEFPCGAIPHVYDTLKLDENNLTLEVQQLLGDDAVRTIVMGSPDGFKRSMIINNTSVSITVPMGKGTLGRIANVLDTPVDEAGPIDTNKHRAIHQTIPKFDELSITTELLGTDVKAINSLCPFTKGGKVGLFDGAGVGKTVNVMELVNSIAKAHSGLSISVDINERAREGSDLYRGMKGSSTLDRMAMVYGQMNEPPGNRLRITLTGLAMIGYFRDERDESGKGRDVLFFMGSIYRYTLADTGVSALLDCMSSAVGYRPTLAEEMGRLQERITSTQTDSVTSIQAVYVPADDLTDLSPAIMSAYLDAAVVLSRDIASLSVYPAIDPFDSTSCQLDPMMLGQEHYDVARGVQSTLQRYKESRDIIAILGMDELLDKDRLIVMCARKTQRFLSQPFHVTEVFIDSPGKYVSLRDTTAGSKTILGGKYDRLPEQAFYMVGNTDGTVERAETVN